MKSHVFLSYCHDNEREATKLCEELSARGENVWWDKKLLPGQDWQMEIRNALHSSYAVIICLSQEVSDRHGSGIYPEASEAIGVLSQLKPGSTFVIPARFSKCDIPSIRLDATRWLDQLQYVDLFPEAKRKDAFERLLKAIRATPHYPFKVSATEHVSVDKHSTHLRKGPAQNPSLIYGATESQNEVQAKFLFKGVLRTMHRILELSPGLGDELMAALNSHISIRKDTAEILLEHVVAIGVNETLRLLGEWLIEETGRPDAPQIRELTKCFAALAVRDRSWLESMRARLTAPSPGIMEVPAIVEPCSLEMLIAALFDRPAQWCEDSIVGTYQGKGFFQAPDSKSLPPESDVLSARLDALVVNLMRFCRIRITRNREIDLALLRQRIQGFWKSGQPLYALFEADDDLVGVIKDQNQWKFLLTLIRGEKGNDLLSDPGEIPVFLERIFNGLHAFEARARSATNLYE
jgi:hypothetical protein